MFHRSTLATAAMALGIAACSGDGCSCMTVTPGGFPPEARVSDAVQVRLSSHAVAKLESDPAALVGMLLGTSGNLSIDIPPSCGGDDPQICCDDAGNPLPTCGPVEIDLAEQPGDLPRLEVNPAAGQSRIDVIVRARIATATPIQVAQSIANCQIGIDTSNGGVDGIELRVSAALPQDPTSGTTRIELQAADLVNLENDDVSINGGIICEGVELFLKGTIVDTVTGTVEDMVAGPLEDSLCKSCPSGDAMECGAFADACTEGVCMIGDRCEQELGIAGRLLASALLDSTGPGGVDIYEVAAGYAESDDGGLSLGLASGMLPAGGDRGRCGPPAPALEVPDIPRSAAFDGNERADTDAPFDVAIGVHQHVFDQLAWAGYEGGLLCLDVGTGTASLLTSNTLGPLLMPSLAQLLGGTISPITIGLRPQAPPTITVGGNVLEGGDVVEPLLDVRFENLEIDFFALIEDQPIRVMTVSADVHLPIGVDVDPNGSLQPVLGNVEEGFSNLAVKNSEALAESPETLAENLPALLSLAVPLLVEGIGTIALPEIAGLGIEIQPGGITSADDDSFAAIYANLAVGGASPVPRVATEARIAEVRATAGGAAIALDLGGAAADGPLEWSFRIDGGTWTPYQADSFVTVERGLLALPGDHTIEVRARVVGQPLSADRDPVVLHHRVPSKLAAATPEPEAAAAEQPAGCASAGGSSGAAALLVLALLALATRRRSGAVALAALLLAAPGCSCGGSNGDDDDDCMGGECMPGEVEHGSIGRFSSLAASPDRVVAAAYEAKLGDLVLVEGGETETIHVVDGVPDEAPTFATDGYRGGIAGKGPDVGAHTSVALDGDRAVIAYVDRETGALKLARETGPGEFSIETVDAEVGAGVRHTALALEGSEPAIAYVAVGVESDAGLVAQLRLARGGTVEVVDEAAISCAGLCADGLACAAVAGAQRCVAPEDGCDCGDGEVCSGGECVLEVAAPPAHDWPPGLGLFADVVVAGGELVIVGYDRVLGDLAIYRRGAEVWERTVVAGELGDEGAWVAAVADADGVVHLAFQDRSAQMLRYATWSAGGGVGGAEVVDDGARDGDYRVHPVGAGAAIGLGAGGEPVVAYQDALTGDLLVARRGGDGWTPAPLLDGVPLFGFRIGLAQGPDGLWLSSYVLDRGHEPLGHLTIQRLTAP